MPIFLAACLMPLLRSTSITSVTSGPTGFSRMDLPPVYRLPSQLIKLCLLSALFSWMYEACQAKKGCADQQAMANYPRQ